MLTRLHITLLLILAVAVWAATLVVLGIPLSWDYLKPFTIAVAVLTTICIVFDKWLWSLSVFKGWLVQRPNLNGTWKATLASDWKDPQTGQSIPPIECVMVITQTFSKMTTRLFTPESNSFLYANRLVCQDDGVFQLYGIYLNTPKVELRGQRSEIHYGALILEVRGDPPTSLAGHYWTDRGTKGSLELSNRQWRRVASFNEGAMIFGLSAAPSGHS
ncbi:MAG: hypothetical protein WDM94_01275 [Bauldia sp.]